MATPSRPAPSRRFLEPHGPGPWPSASRLRTPLTEDRAKACPRGLIPQIGYSSPLRSSVKSASTSAYADPVILPIAVALTRPGPGDDLPSGPVLREKTTKAEVGYKQSALRGHRNRRRHDSRDHRMLRHTAFGALSLFPAAPPDDPRPRPGDAGAWTAWVRTRSASSSKITRAIFFAMRSPTVSNLAIGGSRATGGAQRAGLAGAELSDR